MAATPIPTQNIIELQGVSKWYEKDRERLMVVDNVSLAVEDKPNGEFVAMLGPSGSGKSTVLNMMGGTLAADAGEIFTCGKKVDGPNPDSVTVPQAYTCYPWLSVLKNVEFGLAIQGVPAGERRDTAMHYLELVELADRANARPTELSGGMQQRVAIARALAVKPPIILMDEPFGALDAQTRGGMQQMLLSVWQSETNSIVFVTHDITEALLLADRIIVFSPRPATIVQDLIVPFERPRQPSIVFDEQFIHLTQALVQLLKKAPGQGQLRVSV
jgi:NitT/TauT family transport system ATP-binding protein